ncbi:PQQ-like beta-propeller repeat protein [Micromonospora sp. NBC_01699]|uniref:outer membrane protein assembly factor BamB family protein n=1 Tax=Micromonospora sp. NBC_01699 TaxID=2975984 RepID=UPI002E2F43DD|nr:PQQ-binding-like beta-propeller repeat protein [Micromonospora sp. NBC_01699]
MIEIELGDRLTEPPVGERPLVRTWFTARWVRIAAVLAVLLATMTAAGVGPPRLSAATIPARLGASVVTGTDRIFVIDPVDPTAEPRQQVSAYRLPDGAPLWRVRMPVPGPLGGHTLIGHTLVLTSDWGSVAPRRTVGVDTATGAVSWLRTASYETASADGDVLLWVQDTDVGAGEPGWDDSPNGWGVLSPGTLEAVAPDTGAVRWSLALPAGAVRGYAGPDAPTDPGPEGPLPEAVVTRGPTGRIEVRDLTSGAVVRSANLPRPPTLGSGQWPPQVVGNLLLVPDGAQSLTAYGLDSFDRRWTIDWDVDREPWPQPCGRLLCTFRPQGGVRVLDRDTGAIRWSDPRWSSLLPVGPYLLGSGEARPMLAAGLSVLDPATGRVLGDLGSWQVLGRSPDGETGTGHRQPAGGTRLIGVRIGSDGRAWVADLDPASGSARRLAVLPDVSGDCQTVAGLLVCRRLTGAIGVWRLPG